MEALSSHDSSDVRLLIDNARVAVMKLRYRPNPMTLDPPHAHPQDALAVYLSGGHTWSPFVRGDILRACIEASSTSFQRTRFTVSGMEATTSWSC